MQTYIKQPYLFLSPVISLSVTDDSTCTLRAHPGRIPQVTLVRVICPSLFKDPHPTPSLHFSKRISKCAPAGLNPVLLPQHRKHWNSKHVTTAAFSSLDYGSHPNRGLTTDD